MITTKTIVITGNHLTPALEFIRQLQEDKTTNWQIHYIGHHHPQSTHIDHTLIAKLHVPFYNLDSGKYDRRWLPNTLTGIPKIFISLFTAFRYLRQTKPQLVVSFGGYVSVPVVIASFLLRIPSLTHEQTPVLSLSTKINSFFVKKICLSFPLPSTSPKYVITGNLLRREIYSQTTTQFQNIKSKPFLYFTGGNQGAKFINDLVESLLPKIGDKYHVIHQTGKLHTSLSAPNYHPMEYIESDDIGWVLNQAKVIIGRSGANTCQEIVALNRPSLLIPLPFTQQDEQTKNALWVKSKQPEITQIVPQAQATPQEVWQKLNKLLTTPSSTSKIIPSPNLTLLSLAHEFTN